MPSPHASTDERLAELVLYVAGRAGEDDAFGSKLNAILFHADFLAYFRRGEAITGSEYQKLQSGPAPRRLSAARDALVASGAAVLQEKRLMPLRDAKLELFSGPELAIVDEALAATDACALDQQFAGWQLAEYGETIPYHIVFLPDDNWQPNEETLWVGQELAATL